jgi:CheY-like chemotaxis protein
MTKSVLIVDDEPAIVNVLKLRVEAVGWRALSAHDGVSGLQLARMHHPDLIILDIRMPQQDGLQTLSEIRNSPDIAGIPVVMISGAPDDSQAAFAAGANAFLTKPHRTYDFLQVISDLSNVRAPVTGPECRHSSI